MTGLAAIPDKVASPLPRLASDGDGEVVATARAIDRQLARVDADWHDLAAKLGTCSPQSCADRCEPDCENLGRMAEWLDGYLSHLNAKERDFIRNLMPRATVAHEAWLSARQARWLRDIFARVCASWGV